MPAQSSSQILLFFPLSFPLPLHQPNQPNDLSWYCAPHHGTKTAPNHTRAGLKKKTEQVKENGTSSNTTESVKRTRPLDINQFPVRNSTATASREPSEMLKVGSSGGSILSHSQTFLKKGDSTGQVSCPFARSAVSVGRPFCVDFARHGNGNLLSTARKRYSRPK